MAVRTPGGTNLTKINYLAVCDTGSCDFSTGSILTHLKSSLIWVTVKQDFFDFLWQSCHYNYLPYLSLAGLRLRCRTGFSLVVVSRGYPPLVRGGLLIAAAPLAGEQRLEGRRLQQLWLPGPRAPSQQLRCAGLVAPWHVGSSWIWYRTHASCTGRWILYWWASREAQRLPLAINSTSKPISYYSFRINGKIRKV